MVSPATCQFLPGLQAKTPEEFDAYLGVTEAGGDARVKQARRFLSEYPASELCLRVWELLAEACRAQSDATCAIEAAAEGLKIAPDYLPLLTLHASVESNTSPAPSGAAAGRALKLLDEVKAPRHVAMDTWIRETTRLRAENLASLAIAAYKRGNSAEAVRLLGESVRVDPNPANQYRLGLLYLERGEPAKARGLLDQAARSSDPAIRERARSALAGLRR